MAKFHGEVGYVTMERSDGITEEVATERPLYGDVLENARKLDSNDRIIPDLSVDVSISVMADAYALGHFFAIRYVKWAGVLWEVSSVKPLPGNPRLVLRLGGVYHGPTPRPPVETGGDSGV